jgi:hypothetical protein
LGFTSVAGVLEVVESDRSGGLPASDWDVIVDVRSVLGGGESHERGL